MPTTYFVVPKPGHYGDRTRVVSSHRTYEAARRAATRGYEVREGSLEKGDTFHSTDTLVYPLATDTRASQSELIAGYRAHLDR